MSFDFPSSRSRFSSGSRPAFLLALARTNISFRSPSFSSICPSQVRPYTYFSSPCLMYRPALLLSLPWLMCHEPFRPFLVRLFGLVPPRRGNYRLCALLSKPALSKFPNVTTFIRRSCMTISALSSDFIPAYVPPCPPLSVPFLVQHSPEAIVFRGLDFLQSRVLRQGRPSL